MKIKIDLINNGEKNVFFISDTHIRHSNVLKYDKRPFKDVKEMETVIKDNWNSVVGKNDTEFDKNKKIIDVGCMGFNYKPVSYIELINLIDKNAKQI
jgi:calcineurin-like phosphoesterase family protein